MKIAICTDIYLPQLSGVSDSIAILVSELKRRGHEVRIYAPENDEALPDPTIVRLPAFSLPGSGKNLFFVFPIGMMRDIRHFKPDIIHTHTFSSIGLLSLGARVKLTIPIIATDHTFPALYLKYIMLDIAPMRFAVKKFASWFHQQFDFVTTPSKSMLEELKTYGMTKPSTIISNPIDFNIFKPTKNREELKKKYGITKPAVLIFQRIAPEKNLDFSLNIFKRLCQTIDAELLVVGDGPHKPILEKRVLIEKIPNVRFLGKLRGEHLAEVIQASDVYLITSIENQALTMLQTMACGLPIVGANIGGLPEHVVDNQTGFLISPDDLEGYVEKLSQILCDTMLRDRLGEAGASAIKNFSPQYVGDKFEKVYKDLVYKNNL